MEKVTLSTDLITTYAAYDDNAIYGLGATPEEAIADAMRATRNPDAKFKTAPIEAEFAAHFRAHGFDGKHDTFDLVDGVLVGPPDESPLRTALFEVMGNIIGKLLEAGATEDDVANCLAAHLAIFVACADVDVPMLRDGGERQAEEGERA